MDSLSTQFLTKPLSYRGLELKPHWIYENTGIMGNTLIAFKGPCEVTLDHMVDLEDVKKKAPIYSPEMVHFLGEWFIDSLEQGILLGCNFQNVSGSIFISCRPEVAMGVPSVLTLTPR